MILEKLIIINNSPLTKNFEKNDLAVTKTTRKILIKSGSWRGSVVLRKLSSIFLNKKLTNSVFIFKYKF